MAAWALFCNVGHFVISLFRKRSPSQSEPLRNHRFSFWLYIEKSPAWMRLALIALAAEKVRRCDLLVRRQTEEGNSLAEHSLSVHSLGHMDAIISLLGSRGHLPYFLRYSHPPDMRIPFIKEPTEF
jgi:hypothetical protein